MNKNLKEESSLSCLLIIATSKKTGNNSLLTVFQTLLKSYGNRYHNAIIVAVKL